MAVSTLLANKAAAHPPTRYPTSDTGAKREKEMKLMVRRQIPLMVASILLLAIALSAEAQPCDEKEEKNRAQLQ